MTRETRDRLPSALLAVGFVMLLTLVAYAADPPFSGKWKGQARARGCAGSRRTWCRASSCGANRWSTSSSCRRSTFSSSRRWRRTRRTRWRLWWGIRRTSEGFPEP